VTFHQLRHTAATILLLKNVNPKVVSEMLGHATIAITLDTYSHVLPNTQHSAVAAMEETFSWRVGVVIGVGRDSARADPVFYSASSLQIAVF
jgi:hypothetical protein